MSMLFFGSIIGLCIKDWIIEKITHNKKLQEIHDICHVKDINDINNINDIKNINDISCPTINEECNISVISDDEIPYHCSLTSKITVINKYICKCIYY